jgi:NAD(P)-dependent dehydrogenase (short-subunit alcohol dehydrogenase family)
MPVALVTGASRGLGRELAKALSGGGYSVALNYRSSDKEAYALLAEIGSRDALLVRADVGDAKQVERMAAEIEKRYGRLDVVIANAGITRDNLLLRQSEMEWDETIATNLSGCFNVIKALAPAIARSGGGHIVTVSSYSGAKGKAGQAAYSASKAAVLGLTRCAAMELAEYDIRVNALLPGYMGTGMGPTAAKAMEKAKADSMLGKLSDQDEVAAFVLYLLKTRNITGQVFGLESRIL